MKKYKVNQYLRDNSTVLNGLLVAIFLMEIGFLVFMNLIASDKIVNFDGANAMLHAAEMWKQKALQIPGWVDTTSLELDSPAVFAILLYGVTHDVLLSFGIGNLLMSALYIWAIIVIYKNLGKSISACLMALDLVFIPYCVGMIDYYNMLFFQASVYGMRVLIPLLFLACLTVPKEHYRSAATTGMWGMLLFFTLISGFGAGMYILVSAAIPLFLLFALDLVIDGGTGKYTKYHIGLVGSFFVCAVVGFVANQIGVVSVRGNMMHLTQYENFMSNLSAVFMSLFMVLGAIPVEKNVPVVSGQGLLYLLKTVLVFGILGTFIVQIRCLFQKRNSISLGKYCSWLFLWTLFEVIFCDTRYAITNPVIENRYYLIIMVPMLVLLPMQVEEWVACLMIQNGKDAVFFRYLIPFGVSLGIAFMAAGSIRNTVKLFDANTGYMKNIISWMDENYPDVSTAILLHEPDEQGTFRLLDGKRQWSAYDLDQNSLVVYDYYASYPQELQEENLILLYNWETPEELLGGEQAEYYRKVGSVEWFDVYYSETNPFLEEGE